MALSRLCGEEQGSCVVITLAAAVMMVGYQLYGTILLQTSHQQTL